MRRRLASPLVAAAIVLALAGCGNQWSPPAALPSEPPMPETVDVRSQTVSMWASATDTAHDSVDDAGTPVSYPADNVLDGDPATAWRAPGDGNGVTLEVTFATPVVLTQVGLIPGYAKLDPSTGFDRFPQNRRIVSVRWEFSDGSSAVQTFDDAPTMQRVSVSALADWARITILETTDDGGRDFTPISDIGLWGYVEAD